MCKREINTDVWLTKRLYQYSYAANSVPEKNWGQDSVIIMRHSTDSWSHLVSQCAPGLTVHGIRPYCTVLSELILMCGKTGTSRSVKFSFVGPTGPLFRIRTIFGCTSNFGKKNVYFILSKV